ncbi:MULTISPECIES: WxPxxD family membrane protein [Neobacillus]|jgi:hypothetical protein|uniref:WxPxxD family membrane protein n=1 Tax=Neobacillus sedimentimangrovi TaxID=2699460 RepID=A0ABS8QK92_9BACI|nr:WxPxxD family membrane protein [Neobacillus sedimentimangrovi]AIM15977.1 hypothetical protein HW35_06280 [Bacillus sp. X1(2014)]MCD4839647.1 WxPxxD family membrane protein [Neobacillus sedimentimangrovi]
MKIKRSIIIIITILFFTIVWFVQNSNQRDIPILKSTNLSLYDVIVIMNNSAFGYSSIQAYTLFYTVPFIIFLNHFFLPENLINIIRGADRERLYLRRLTKIMIVALIFSFIHSGINLLFTSIFFDYSLLKEMNFIPTCLFNTLGLFLFYTSVGLMYELIKDISNSVGISFFLTILLISGLFFFEKLIMNQTWGPLKDLVIYNKMLEKKWTVTDLLYTYFRQFLIVGFFYLIGSFVYKRKDFIQ